MRRVTPLRRTAQLAQVIPLHREQPLARVVEIRPRSRKQATLYREHRVPLVKELLTVRPWCEIRWDNGCQGRAVEVHEPAKRSQGVDICDPAACVTTCWYCHSQVHRNPAAAARRGWLRTKKAVATPDGGDAA
jgi:hypothetical protein